MYRLSRLLLILTVVAALYSGCLLVELTAPWSLIAVVALGLMWADHHRRRQPLTAYGTARTADLADLRRAGMVDTRAGLILGRLPAGPRALAAAAAALFDPGVGSRSACRQFLTSCQGRPYRDGGDWVRLSRAVHTVVFAPTGAGKGVSCIVPFLLNCPDACVVVDFKGENAKLTARHRRRMFGHRIVYLDPFRVATPRPDDLNPLDGIGPTAPTALDDIRAMAEALVVRSGQEREPHWAESAELWIAAMTACVGRYAPAADRSLQTARGLLTDPKKMETSVQLLCASGDEFLARLGHQLSHYQEKERASTLTTTNRFLRFLDTPAVAASTRASTFDPADLRRGRMTVYLVLPPEHMRTCMGLLRLWVGTLMRAVVRGGLQEANQVHFVLDEAASLGHGMNALHDAVDKYRGYGVRCQFYYQSMGQLKQCWPEDQGQTLLSNTAQMFFGVNDLPTAEYVSARLGSATVVVASGGSTAGRSISTPTFGPGTAQGNRGESWGRNDNWSQIGRKILTPDEVLNLDPRTAITFAQGGVPPVVTLLLRYFEEPAMGRPPGWVRRGLIALKTLALATAFFVLAGLFAIGMTAEARDGMRRATPGAPPFPDTPFDPAWPAAPVGRYSDTPSPFRKAGDPWPTR